MYNPPPVARCNPLPLLAFQQKAIPSSTEVCMLNSHSPSFSPSSTMNQKAVRRYLGPFSLPPAIVITGPSAGQSQRPNDCLRSI